MLGATWWGIVGVHFRSKNKDAKLSGIVAAAGTLPVRITLDVTRTRTKTQCPTLSTSGVWRPLMSKRDGLTL